jgi:hypothetical protein
MTQAHLPSKQTIRQYLERRCHERKPPPAPEEVRRQLGWALPMPSKKLGAGSV